MKTKLIIAVTYTTLAAMNLIEFFSGFNLHITTMINYVFIANIFPNGDHKIDMSLYQG